MMKATDIREMSAAEIEQRIAEETRDITDLKFRRTVTGLENPIVLRDKRRTIARMKTVLREKRGTETVQATTPPASTDAA